MSLLIQVLIGGMTIGSIYSLIAIGFVLIFKSSGVLNFAQGSMVMVLLVVFLLFFKYSKLGLSMRAAADNQKVAVALGISAKKILSVTWIISALVATAGGILLASISALHINLSYIGLIVFPVVILGGLDSVAGAAIGGIIVGIIESVSGVYIAPYLGGAFQQVAAFIFLMIILLVRPYGLFGTKEIRRL